MVGYTQARHRMVEDQLIRRGIGDDAIIDAMRRVERHRFVDEGLLSRAYKDTPLPIGSSQTISQPYIVALMTESLKLRGADEKVLEVGTGSGYQAAVLATLGCSVFTVERDAALARRARRVLDDLGHHKIAIRVGDGSIGWRQFQPYDGILVTAATPMVPPEVLRQLKDGGRLIIPLGGTKTQRLHIFERQGDTFHSAEVCSCAFVPLIRAHGGRNGSD